jgi:hypothetical protein
VAREGDHWTIRLTSEAVKHKVVKVAASGDVLGPLQGFKNRLAEFARALVTDPNVAPMHGWRHRFKTVGMEAGIPHTHPGRKPRSRVEDTRRYCLKVARRHCLARAFRCDVEWAIEAGVRCRHSMRSSVKGRS